MHGLVILNPMISFSPRLSPWPSSWIFWIVCTISKLKSIMKFQTSLVVQWLRICLPRQGTQVQSLVWEDSMCQGATESEYNNYWAHMPSVCSLQQEKPLRWEGSTLQLEQPPLAATGESPCNEGQAQPKIVSFKNLKNNNNKWSLKFW